MHSSAFFTEERIIEASLFENPVAYADGYALQRELHREVAASEIPDQLILLEHTPVYTLGKRGEEGDFLISRDLLMERGAEVAEIDRGGQITYHGPGQIVLYIISNLGDRARSIRKFVHLLEQVVIDYLSSRFSIDSARDPKHPGVWVGEKKIAALGISIHEKTTMHGFALNIHTDLSEFDAIVPCGIRDRGVCSVESLLGLEALQTVINGKSVDLGREMEGISRLFQETYGYSRLRLTRVH